MGEPIIELHGDHHAECVVVPWRELSADWDEQPPEELLADLPEGAGIVRCHPECPALAEAVALGKKLGDRFIERAKTQAAAALSPAPEPQDPHAIGDLYDRIHGEGQGADGG